MTMILRIQVILIGCCCLLGTYGDDSVEVLGCVSPWIQIHRSCYTFIQDDMKSWDDAEQMCVRMGGHLMSITNKNEMKKFEPELRTHVTNKDLLNWWVGLKRNHESDPWIWLDGEELNTKVIGWAHDASETEPCVELNYQVWIRDMNCSLKRPFICEDMKVTPTSTATAPTRTTATTTTTTGQKTNTPSEERTTHEVDSRSTSRSSEYTGTRTKMTKTPDEHTPSTDGHITDKTIKPTNKDTTKTTKDTTRPTKEDRTKPAKDTTKPTKKTTTPPSNTTPRPGSQKPDKDDYIGCYAVNTETSCPPVHALGISWPRTEAGKLATVDCGQGQAKWRCQKNPVVCWKDEPDIKQCTSEEIQELTQQADEILTTEDNTDLTISFTDGLATTLANDSISEQDMFQSTKLMATAAKANAKNKTSAKKIIKNVVRCGNSLVASNKQSTWKNMEKATQRAVASSLLDSMEAVSMEMIKIFDTPGVEKIEEDNMAVELHVIDVDQLDTPGRSDIVYEGEENTFSIPPATLKQFSSGGLARLVFIDYKNIAALLTPEVEDATASDDEAPGVISQVLGASIDGGNDEKLAKNVVFTFQTNHTGKSENWKQTCSFWNFSLGYTGAWSGRGCSFVRANETHTTCECDHLTNFAILLDVHSTKMANVHAITLSYITYIGIIISIICLFLSWVTFVCLSTVQGERNTIHKHLVFCMFVAEILFLAGIERTDKKVACSIIAGFLHFFFLGSFMWMFMEGVHILFMLVQVFDAARSRLKYYYIMGYGGPLLTVGVSALVYYEGYGTEQYCWLTTDRWFIWSFAGPVAFILLVNLIILIYALSAVCKHSEYVFSKDKSPSGNLKGWVQGALALEVLLGLTWVFGYFYISEEAIVVAYLFTIFNSLQGVFIFIFHCLLNKKVRKEYQHFIEYMAPSTGTHTTSKSGGHQNGVPLASRKQSDFSNINLKMSRAGSTTRL